MRPLYLFLRITLPYIFTVYYKRRKTIGAQKKYYAQTIFVCNHPSAFIDPLIIASAQKPIMFFLVRSDIFKPWLTPVTWACQMAPIYRAAEDGKESHEKNKDVLKGVQKVLINKKSVIIFGEGYTDNTFIRSLKPIKKGAARMAFAAMEACDWNQDIKVQATCINYTAPGKFRSEMAVVLAEPIHLLEYKELYQENPAKANTELTRRITAEMQAHLTYIEDKNHAPFLEHLLMLSRKGMNHENNDPALSLEDKLFYSRDLAQRINKEYKDSEQWQKLKEGTDSYFEDQKKTKVAEKDVFIYSSKNGKNIGLNILLLILLLPALLVGIAHGLIPYLLVKLFVEKKFKRPVFWSGVKQLLGATVFTLYNLPIFYLFHEYVYPSYWLALVYFLVVPAISFVLAYNWYKRLKETIRIIKTDSTILSAFKERRDGLLEKMKAMNI